MKFSTMMAVFAVGIAVVASGCKYDKVGANGGAGAGKDDAGASAQEIDSEVDDINVQDIESADDSGSLDDIAGTAGKSFEELYQRCNDVAFAPVYFGFDSTVVPQAELGKIDAVASHLAENANRVVVVEGHCDERGANEYNMSLGESRAKIVRNYLVQNGISDDRIETHSYGEERPVAQGSGEEVWQRNRRGEFVIFQK